MAESINSKRVFFPKGKQNKLINRILLKITLKDAAKICNLSERTIRDWYREKFSMDIESLRKLSKKTDISIPSNIKLKNRYWYVHSGSSAGGKAVLKKYGRIGGNPEYRKKKWREWWEKEGKFNYYPFIGVTKPISKPRYSQDLAEFIGIVLGDGGITQYQVTFTLHSEDDKEYGKFVIHLTKKLFNVPVSIYLNKKYSATNYVVSRKELVEFLTKKIGLKIGNKISQQIDIPLWIKNNKNYSIACLRGLIDTDGCVFTHRYKVNNKIYSYKKLSFTSLSKPLLLSAHKILKDIRLSPRLAGKKDVRLDSIKDMKRYFQLIGSHNPKHLKRYLN